ncbi:alpha/beta hydrolase [Temperatibacter marinus]|uniref:Alpha/beta hydrolase n=1 Tax=Temperatibacter marinus TaxID=1456591 RepID=A0AA52EDA0_9PROT|nr:alpha/beta hydrolase [Temperatibacter marinus]WND02656.1 alpha/beta hydrolase [Temperatibacter marinus]
MPETSQAKTAYSYPSSQENSLRRTEPSGGRYDYFDSFDGAKIRYGLWPIPNAQGTVILLGGRTEFIEKFYEDMHNWHARGYSVAAMDWRGQGLSERLLSHWGEDHRERHYLKNFDDLIADLKFFFDTILVNEMPKPFILMGHSQAGHSILRFIHDHGALVEKAICIAPMVDIFMPLPDRVTNSLLSIAEWLGQDYRYVPGHKAFKDGRWGWRKKLTNDEERFEDEDWFIHNKDRKLAVGGVTFGWLKAAKQSIHRLNSPGFPESITTPTLIFQAGDDEIVDNKAQTTFAKRMPHVGLVRIEGAKHELLKETDSVREKVWKAIDHFIAP